MSEKCNFVGCNHIATVDQNGRGVCIGHAAKPQPTNMRMDDERHEWRDNYVEGRRGGRRKR